MSTRSFIGVADKFFEDNTFDHCKIVYCHWDGYPENNGRILMNHYDSAKKINALVDKGGMSSLGETLNDCNFYEEENELPTVWRYKEFVKMVSDSAVEWIYLYDLSNDKWMCAQTEWCHKGNKYPYKISKDFGELSDYFKNIRCCIGVAEKVDEDSLQNCRVVYVDRYGDPDDVCPVLDHYNSKELVEDLLSHGGMIGLGDSVDSCIFYRKNNQRSKVAECADLPELLEWQNRFFRKKDGPIDFTYLYDVFDSKWKSLRSYWNENKKCRETWHFQILAEEE